MKKKYLRFYIGRGFENKNFGWISLVLDTKYILDEEYIKEKDIDIKKLFKIPFKIYNDRVQLLFTLYKENNKNSVNVTHRLAYLVKRDKDNQIQETNEEQELYEIIKNKKIQKKK